MNKRQRKKNKKKNDMFTASFVSSYRELKEIDRSYRVYIHNCNKRQRAKGFALVGDFELDSDFLVTD